MEKLDINKIRKNLLFPNKEWIIELRNQKKSFPEICEIIGYKSRGTLSNFCKKNNI